MTTNSYYIPFIIIVSPKEIILKDFLPSKTFQYKIYLNGKEMKEEKEGKISAFFRKLNVLFCYYNELGDEFSFLNSNGEEKYIKIEDDTDITVFINILFLGRSGAGKSTLINLLLGEKKSLEGGTGFSTTSKKIIVYKKAGVPLRFYDVKGIENEDTIENYAKILTDFNENNAISIDSLNSIFYCIEYKINGTIIEEMEFKLFEKLIQFNIQIIFLITKTPYDIRKNHKNIKTEKAREAQRKRIINALYGLIKSIFKKNNKKEEEGEKFIDNYVKIFFVNLVRDESLDIPVFGIDEVINFFSNSVPKEKWEELERFCILRDEEKCKECCKNNPFFRYYSEFGKINEKNIEEGKNYLKQLLAGAFFSGMIPGLDIGMEYFYRNKFKKKLKSLYGFDYDRAENIVEKKKDNKDKSEEMEYLLDNKKSKINGSYISKNSGIYDETMNDLNNRSINTIITEEKIESKINREINNTGKNSTSIVRGLGEVGGIILKSLPTAGQATGEIVTRVSISAGLKLASWILLPITCIGFGTWSLVKINKDCDKILNIFSEAFTPLRFDTLLAYVNSFRAGINFLENISKKLIEYDNDEEKNYFNF